MIDLIYAAPILSNCRDASPNSPRI